MKTTTAARVAWRISLFNTRRDTAFSGRSQLREFLYWVASAVVLVAAWEWSVTHFQVSEAFFPRPSAVATALLQNLSDGTFARDLATTLTELALGFCIGSFVGFLFAMLIAELRLARIILYPYVVCLQSIPKTAIAPMMLVWFGFGIESKVALVVLASFFPVLVNTLSGIARTDPEQLAMLKAFCGKRHIIFWKVKLPSALPSIFAGLELAIMLGLLGAVVSEFLGSTGGLGYRILVLNTNLDMAGQFAALVVLAATGFTLHSAVRQVGRRVVFWGRAASDGAINV